MVESIACKDCGKECASEESLAQHAQAKHSGKVEAAPKKSMKLTKKHYVFAVILFVLALFVFWSYNSLTAEGKYDEFARCLTESNVTFYGAYWCPHCAEQKHIFGKSSKLLPYFECSLPDRSGQTQICNDAGIESYPTWEFADSSRQTGVLNVQQLAQYSGCTLGE
jgi:thiol-disulfide isomerase/thioredoxin